MKQSKRVLRGLRIFFLLPLALFLLVLCKARESKFGGLKSSTVSTVPTSYDPILALEVEQSRLAGIFKRHQSAKVGEFMSVYPPIFASYTLRHLSKFSLLEIGNRRGETLRAYLEIFSKGDIYGLDLGVDEYKVHNTFRLNRENKRAHLFVGDQSDVDVLNRIGSHATSLCSGFDIITDDGGHTMLQQTASLVNLWKFLKPGG